jgi:sugar-specific transcriptional regulator TrmB
MVEDTLKQLGFNDKEVVVYLTVLQHGKLSPSEIAKRTQINRTTVYSSAKELVKKGFLVEDLGGTSRSFVAVPPKQFEQIVKREQDQLENKKLLVMRAVNELSHYEQEARYTVPKIVFVEEQDIKEHLYKQAPVWNASIKQRKVAYWGFQDSTFVEQYQDWIDWYWSKEESTHGVELKLFSTTKAEKIKQKKYEHRQIRFWDKAKDFTATEWVMGDYVTSIVTNQKPHYLVEIHDKTMAHNIRQIYLGLWAELFKGK